MLWGRSLLYLLVLSLASVAMAWVLRSNSGRDRFGVLTVLFGSLALSASVLFCLPLWQSIPNMVLRQSLNYLSVLLGFGYMLVVIPVFFSSMAYCLERFQTPTPWNFVLVRIVVTYGLPAVFVAGHLTLSVVLSERGETGYPNSLLYILALAGYLVMVASLRRMQQHPIVDKLMGS